MEFCKYLSGCYDFSVYLVDILDKKILYDDKFKIEESDNKYFKTCFYLADQDSKVFLCRFYRSNRFKNDVDYLFDSEFNIFAELPAKIENSFPCAGCEYGNYFAGIQMTENRLNAFYLKTRYKDRNTSNKYFIPYSFNPDLEILFGKVYDNEKLDREDFKKLSVNELDLLRNFIFAKNNYRFKSLYYQAYFSMFDFYSNAEAEQNRLSGKEINLSEVDKYNLDVILKTTHNSGS